MMNISELCDIKNKDYKVVFTPEKIANDHLMLNKDFFSRLFSRNGELNENSRKLAALIEAVKDSLSFVDEIEKIQMDRIVNQVNDELQEKRYKYRELLDAADGLAISSSVTGIAGAVNSWNPNCWILLATQVAQTRAQIGCQVETDKKKREFLIRLGEVGIEIHRRLQNKSAQRFQDSMQKAMGLIAEIHGTVDPVQMVMQMIILALKYPVPMETIMANLYDFYGSEKASEVVKTILQIDKEVDPKDPKSIENLSSKYAATITGQFTPYSAVFRDASTIVFSTAQMICHGILRHKDATTLVAINASLGGYCDMQAAMGLVEKLTKISNRLTVASNVIAALAIAAGVITTGFSIASLVEQGQEVKEIDEMIKTSREKYLKYNQTLYEAASLKKYLDTSQDSSSTRNLDPNANADIGDPVSAKMLPRPADSSDYQTPHQDNNAPISAQSSGAQSQTAAYSNASHGQVSYSDANQALIEPAREKDFKNNQTLYEAASLKLDTSQDSDLLNRGYVIAKNNFDLCKFGDSFSEFVQKLWRQFRNGSDGFREEIQFTHPVQCWDAVVKCPSCSENIVYSIRMLDFSKISPGIQKWIKLHPFRIHKESSAKFHPYRSQKGCRAHGYLTLYHLFCTKCQQPFADNAGGCACTGDRLYKRHREIPSF